MIFIPIFFICLFAMALREGFFGKDHDTNPYS